MKLLLVQSLQLLHEREGIRNSEIFQQFNTRKYGFYLPYIPRIWDVQRCTIMLEIQKNPTKVLK